MWLSAFFAQARSLNFNAHAKKRRGATRHTFLPKIKNNIKMNLLSGVLHESQYHGPSSSTHHTLTSNRELIVGSILSINVNSRVVVVILVTPLQLGGKIIEEMFNLVELMEPPSQTTEALQVAVVAIPIIAIIARIAIVWRDLNIVTIAHSSLDGHVVRSNR
jgi:hypothetical protein